MDNQTAQAFAEFERFLRGKSAPALVGHALATVIRYDVGAVAETVLRSAFASGGPDRFATLLTARAKVFEIFFYRIVRFRRIYEFFPRFERALVEAAPAGDRAAIVDLFKRYPWQEIRPIGTFQGPLEFALENRPSAGVSTEGFNEDLYRNATHQILSADRRYTFDDAGLQENVADAQAKVGVVFDDFVSLIKDAILRREIMLANEADKDVVYTNQPRFQVESYLSQLADLAIALFNDEFLEHSVQIFGIIRLLASASEIDVEHLAKLQTKSELINRQKLAQYSSSRTGPLLLRSILPLFPQWRPDQLLEKLARDQDPAERDLALAVLTAYGRDVYSVAVDALERCDPTGPWQYRRNLAYLIGHLACDQPALKQHAVQVLAVHLRKEGVQQLNVEVVNALSSIRTDQAVATLVGKLGLFAPDFGRTPEATDVCNRIVAALVEVQSETSLKAAVDFCLAHGVVEQHYDEFARAMLPDALRAELAAGVRKEIRKLKMSFSMLGNATSARAKLLALGSATTPDVAALVAEVASAFPPHHELAAAAERLKEAPPPLPPLTYDRTFHRLLTDRNLPEALSYAFEAGMGGHLEIQTRGGIPGDIKLRKGDVWHSAVPSLFSKDIDAFYWLFALERAALAETRFDPASVPSDARTLPLPTPELIREGLFRAKHVQQTITSILSPESRFRRRQSEFPESVIKTTGTLGPYKAVWVCLARPVDLKTIAGATGLSEHEIYRVLFDLLRQNLLDVETGAANRQLATLDDAMTALGLFLRRIQANPTYFQPYQSAAEVCAYLSNEAADETVRSTAYALHTYLLNAFNLRRVMSVENVSFCERVLALLMAYLRTGSDLDRRELLEFLDVYLPEENRWPAPAQDEDAFIQSILEQIENIEVVNDPYDVVTSAAGPPPAAVAMRTLDDALSGALDGGGGALDTRSPLELLGDTVGEYVKPLKDFVREIDRNLTTDRETSSAWLRQAAPSVELLVAAAGRVEAAELLEAGRRLERAFAQQRGTDSDVLTPAFCRYVVTEYQKLVAILPKTFSLEEVEEDVEAKKRTLFLRFVLRQVPDVNDVTVNRLVVAGFSTFEDIAETAPDDLARAAGIDRKLAEKIFMKLYQYEDLYYHPTDPQAHAKLLAYYVISLNVLKEIHASVERLAEAGEAASPRKEKLLADRQRALWGLFAILCLRNALDLIERLQRVLFDQRIQLLEEYFATLSAEPFPTTRRRRRA
jgi:hypothetical protein